MSPSPVLSGAEPLSVVGTLDAGVLVLHGFTGSPQSMRPLAQAFAAADLHVELPLLPGHGTNAEEMALTRWEDWSAAAEQALADLQQRCSRVVVAGLSMGGAITSWLASRHPEISGIVLVNPAVLAMPEEVRGQVAGLLEQGVAFIPGLGSDIAAPGVTELAYEMVPVASALSMNDAIAGIVEGLPNIACPVLLMTSPQDHVVPPAASEIVAERASGPVERVSLDRSFHVATLDLDREVVETRAVAFARRVLLDA